MSQQPCPCCGGTGVLDGGDPDCPYCQEAGPGDDYDGDWAERWPQVAAGLQQLIGVYDQHGIPHVVYRQLRALFAVADAFDTEAAYRQAADAIAGGGQFTDEGDSDDEYR